MDDRLPLSKVSPNLLETSAATANARIRYEKELADATKRLRPLYREYYHRKLAERQNTITSQEGEISNEQAVPERVTAPATRVASSSAVGRDKIVLVRDSRKTDKPKNPLQGWNARKERPQKSRREVSSESVSAKTESSGTPEAPIAHAGGPAQSEHLADSSADSKTRPDDSLTVQLPSSKRPHSELQPIRKSSVTEAHKRAADDSTQTSNQHEWGLMTDGNRRPPAWYSSIDLTKVGRSKHNTGPDILLERLKAQIMKAKHGYGTGKGPESLEDVFYNVRGRLHKLIFQTMSKELLRLKRMLHNESGLPQLFDEKWNGGVPWPVDIRADAEELYNKWCAQDFETDLMRGLVRKKRVGKQGESGGTSWEINKNWTGRRSAKYFGNGKLLNGQWWPTQLCAVRDGAHGQTIRGIHGDPELGAYSALMSDGYADDIDNGDEVLCCGTDAHGEEGGSPSGDTMIMMKSKGRNPVRFFRTSKCRSVYAPKAGLRYDGLYDIVDWESLDGPGSVRQRHRFRLVRRAAQDPLRGEGAAKRPTDEELEEYAKDKRLRGD